MPEKPNYTVCLAPMMDYTDRYFRYLIRLLSKKTLLFTEMVNCQAIAFGNKEKLLSFHNIEHPLVLQLGGRDIEHMANAAVIAESYGYDEVNINVGCPSLAVKSGGFGASLMLEPDLVAKMVQSMKDKVTIPVTIKCRIGVDEYDSYEFVHDFIDKIANIGCDTFYVHARKAWLSGLSPKQNREIPPLSYDTVYKLKKDLPSIRIIINGGINTTGDISSHLKHVDGVMLGRKAINDTYMFAHIDRNLYEIDCDVPSREEASLQYLDYIKNMKNIKPIRLTRHLLGLWHGEKNSSAIRRAISSHETTLEDLYRLFFSRLDSK